MSPRSLRNLNVGNFKCFSLSSYGSSFKYGSIFVALLWTFSIASMSFFRYGFQIHPAYSRCDRTRALNSKQKVLKSKYRNDRLISPTIWLALFTLVWMCWSMLTPTSFSQFIVSNVVMDPSYVSIWYLPFSLLLLCFVVIGRTLHLFGWKRNNHFSLQLNSLSMSSWTVWMSLWWAIALYNFVSSANMNTSESTQSGKSLINTTNKIGHSTEPCGIPLVTLCHCENSPLTCTRCLQLLRKLRIHKHVWSLILYDLSLFMRHLCGTLSKAFMKSSVYSIYSPTPIKYASPML
jgi:hypothetical protein